MKFHYMGKFNGDEESLPKREHEPNYVKFKEFNNMKLFSIISNIGAVAILIGLCAITNLIVGELNLNYLGFILFFPGLIVHEFLHAICFKEDVYMYNNLKQGNLFVLGPEAMTKFRFCFMSLCPCIVLGIIPYTLFMINHNFVTLGTLGILSISSCIGDFMNVFNAITQMPKGAKTYLSGMNSYWYMPKKEDIENKENTK